MNQDKVFQIIVSHGAPSVGRLKYSFNGIRRAVNEVMIEYMKESADFSVLDMLECKRKSLLLLMAEANNLELLNELKDLETAIKVIATFRTNQSSPQANL